MPHSLTGGCREEAGGAEGRRKPEGGEGAEGRQMLREARKGKKSPRERQREAPREG